jgi:hypothetical protein
VLLAYVDESGDDGIRKKGSRTYTLGCVMVDSADWTATFDQLIAHRRWLRNQFGIPVRAELKANYLLRNGGLLRARPLSESARFAIYRSFMRLQPKLGLDVFAVVVDKQEVAERFENRRAASEVAWEYLLQRLERRTTKSNPKTEVLLVHDEGDELTVRGHARKARRAGSAGSAFGTGSLSRPFMRLIDDPVPRSSNQSYFLQMADMDAYAAFRRLHPPPKRRVQIVPHAMWDELGDARFRPVRSLHLGDPAGIVPGP